MTDYAHSSLILIVLASTFSIAALAGGIIIILVRHHKSVIQNRSEILNIKEEYQKKLIISSINSQERERERIARDLHDEIGASLSAAKLTLSLCNNYEIPQQDVIGKVNEILDNTIINVKVISQDLLPLNLKKFGLSPAIRDFCNKISAKDLSISLIEKGESSRLGFEVELCIYRIAQELISNAVQHSKASLIQVILHWNFASVELMVIDNGVGIQENTITMSKGLGMNNIHFRAQIIDGIISLVKPENGIGTLVSLIVPLKKE